LRRASVLLGIATVFTSACADPGPTAHVGGRLHTLEAALAAASSARPAATTLSRRVREEVNRPHARTSAAALRARNPMAEAGRHYAGIISEYAEFQRQATGSSAKFCQGILEYLTKAGGTPVRQAALENQQLLSRCGGGSGKPRVKLSSTGSTTPLVAAVSNDTVTQDVLDLIDAVANEAGDAESNEDLANRLAAVMSVAAAIGLTEDQQSLIWLVVGTAQSTYETAASQEYVDNYYGGGYAGCLLDYSSDHRNESPGQWEGACSSYNQVSNPSLFQQLPRVSLSILGPPCNVLSATRAVVRVDECDESFKKVSVVAGRAAMGAAVGLGGYIRGIVISYTATISVVPSVGMVVGSMTTGGVLAAVGTGVAIGLAGVALGYAICKAIRYE
jgi:hypothetical protein